MPDLALPEQVEEDKWFLSGMAPVAFDAPLPPLGVLLLEGGDDLQCPDGPSNRIRLGTSLAAEPSTPRAMVEQQTPPCTPRKGKAQMSKKLSPPPAPREASLPPLLRALHWDSAQEVQRLLTEDPKAALEPFWDHRAEPPLCAAVRLECSVEICRLLLQHSADIDGMDMRGRSALAILAETTPAGSSAWEANAGFEINVLAGSVTVQDPAAQTPYTQRLLEISEVLIAGGSNPMSSGPNGTRPIDLAIAAGNRHLVDAWESLII